MAVHPTVHPSSDVLQAFALGRLNDNTATVVISHLESCPDCCKIVAAFSGDDFLDRLRGAHGPSSTPAPPKSLADASVGSKPPLPTLPAQNSIPNLPAELANNSQYEILRELGRGGMGVVYLARNRLMDRLEVLKVVNKSLLDRPGAVERFLREIRSAAKLSHANIVTAHHALQVGELLAFAMEYIEGQDLASVVKTQGPLPVAYACYYVQQAALGLQHASEKGMVHRDIKPQNLILARDGRKHIVKVLDFGLAKVMREKSEDTGLTAEGAMLGTPDYIAPEQSLDAAKADIRADIYSLGCTLYYLLSGRPPFSASSLGAILMAHNTQEARPLNLLRPEVPEELAAVVRKMMAKSPAKRYQTPLEVVQALAPFIKQGTTPKSAPELSSGTAEVKSTVKKTLRVAPPPPPVAEAAKQPPTPADVWGSLTDDSVASVAPRKNKVVSKPRAATVRERQSRNKWLVGGGLGAGVLLLALMGMWAGGCFKGKTPEGSKQSPEEKITNSIGMKLVLVKTGTFFMGSPASEAERAGDEEQHEVEITHSLYVGVYEVTQEQYERVIGKNPSFFSPTGDGKDQVRGLDTWQYPVEMVSWEDAVGFCRRLSERPEEKAKGRKYRLPTEAEWEYICRDGPYFKNPSPPFHFGNSLSSNQANFNGDRPYGAAPKGPCLDRTRKVGSYPHNALGLYDLHGNVREWCNDWYEQDYYKKSPRQNPEGPGPGPGRVLRGGSWVSYSSVCRAAYRSFELPAARYGTVGFRVVFVAGPKN
jgi:serine/threonine protein kinase